MDVKYLFAIAGFVVYDKNEPARPHVVRLAIVDSQSNNFVWHVTWNRNLERFEKTYSSQRMGKLVNLVAFYRILKQLYPAIQVEIKKPRMTEVPDDVVGILLETQGFQVIQRTQRSDWGTVLLIFKRGDELYQSAWMSFEQRMHNHKTEIWLDEVMDLRPVYAKLRELFPRTGYFYDDPELREMLGGWPDKKPVSAVS